MSNSARPRPPRSATELLEEAVRLLRRAPASVLLCHLLGSMPCLLYSLYFFTDLSRSVTAREHVMESSLTFAALYCWMKCWQTVSSAILRAALLRVAAPVWTSGRVLRLIASQVLLQPVGLLLRFVASVVLIPYVWTATFFQNITVLGDGAPGSLRELSASAWAQAKLWPKQAHGLAALLTIFGFFIYLNLGIAMFGFPLLLKNVFGWETALSQHSAGLLNPTFFLAVLAGTYLCLDPIRKAAVVWRCFYGGSIRSGEDLAVELKSLRRPLRAAAVLAVGLWLTCNPAGRAEVAPAKVDSVELNRSIDDVLEGREFAWRTPFDQNAKKPTAKLGLVAQWRKDFQDWLQRVSWKTGKSIGEMFRKLREQLFGPSKKSERQNGDLLSWLDSVRAVFWVLLVLSSVVLLVLVVRARRRLRERTVTAEAIAPAPDLREENVTADQLPEDGWLRLADDLRQRGELRLALRASYLASLAHLGQRELLRLARHKSNHDYDRELRRRARTQQDLLTAFDRNLTAFERAWYGEHEVTGETLGTFAENLQRIRAC